MKMILAALTATAVLAAAPVPASAEMDLAGFAKEAAELAGPEVAQFAKVLKQRMPRQMEHDTSKQEVGSSEWWQQYDRERGGRGRR